MAEEKEEEFVFEDWLAEGIRGFKASAKKIVPEEVVQHFKSADREILLAIRSLIDKAIEWTEAKPEEEK